MSPCYETRNWNKQLSVQITFALSDQDQRNLNILEDYWTNLADKMIDIDKKSQKINDLISKTPPPILPKNANNDNSNLQQSITPVANRFQSVVNADIKITDLTNSINANVQRYNQIVTNLNNILTEVKSMIFNGNKYEHNPIVNQPDVAQQVLNYIKN